MNYKQFSIIGLALLAGFAQAQQGDKGVLPQVKQQNQQESQAHCPL